MNLGLTLCAFVQFIPRGTARVASPCAAVCCAEAGYDVCGCRERGVGLLLEGPGCLEKVPMGHVFRAIVVCGLELGCHCGNAVCASGLACVHVTQKRHTAHGLNVLSMLGGCACGQHLNGIVGTTAHVCTCPLCYWFSAYLWHLHCVWFVFSIE